MSEAQSDALVFFGATGDLAYKKIIVDPKWWTTQATCIC
jgi:glucose-6-phosphate 1-dehydrogenase